MSVEMSSLPPATGPRAPAPSSAAPAPQGVLWVYVDEGRTHELHVGLRKRESLEFVVTERAMEEPTTHPYERATPIGSPAESRIHHLLLEERLTLLGRYHRHSVGTRGGWSPVRRVAAVRSLDVAPLQFEGIRKDVRAHFYGSRHGSLSLLLLVVPQEAHRHALLRLELAFPDAAEGRLAMAHPRLHPVLLRSALAEAHLDALARGLEKVSSVARRSPEEAKWCDDASRAIETALTRAREGRFGGSAPRLPPSPRVEAQGHVEPSPRFGAQPQGAGARGGGGGGGRGGGMGPARVITMGAEPRRLAAPPGWKLPERLTKDETPYEVEYEVPEDHEKAPLAPVATIEDNTVDFQTALAHPRILALHERFFAPGEEAALCAEGELALRAAMKAKRAAAPRGQQHLLSILEASVLVRYALMHTTSRKIDPQMADLLRRAPAYLA